MHCFSPPDGVSGAVGRPLSLGACKAPAIGRGTKVWEGGHCYEDQVLPTIPMTHHTIKPNTFLQEMEGEVAALYKQLEAAGADPRHTHRCSGDQQWELNAFFNAAAQGRQLVGLKDIGGHLCRAFLCRRGCSFLLTRPHPASDPQPPLVQLPPRLSGARRSTP